jgi:hypothetical protein
VLVPARLTDPHRIVAGWLADEEHNPSFPPPPNSLSFPPPPSAVLMRARWLLCASRAPSDEKSRNGFPDLQTRHDQRERAGFWDARRTAVAQGKGGRMARPLTKVTADDAPLKRPAVIEAQIDTTLQLPPSDLRAQLSIGDRRNADHLRSETLVHLVRHGRRRGDQSLISLVLPVLLGRCETNMLITVGDRELPEAATIREDILGAFSELFASDGTGDNPDELDFYECKFNLAFRCLRIDIVRRDIARLEHVAQITEPGDDEEPHSHDEVFARVSEAFRLPATQEGHVLRADLHKAILELPPEERDAVILVHVLGYPEESQDPDEETAATRCKCTGRTIRNRLKRAAMKLARFKEAL